MYPHRIRLREPWQRAAGRHRRRFGLPRTLDDYERIWLLVGGSGPARVALNGADLGALDLPGELLLPPLWPRNEFDIQADDLGDVALEIRRTAFLVNLAYQKGELTGGVAGFTTADDEAGPLEVYALADGRTLGRVEVRPGQPFALQLAAEPAGPLHVELIKGASVWDARGCAGGKKFDGPPGSAVS